MGHLLPIRTARSEDGTHRRTTQRAHHRFKDDIGLYPRLGARAYRFSIRRGEVVSGKGTGAANPVGLGLYDRLVDELLKKRASSRSGHVYGTCRRRSRTAGRRLAVQRTKRRSEIMQDQKKAPVPGHRFYSRTGRWPSEFCDESVDQTSGRFPSPAFAVTKVPESLPVDRSETNHIMKSVICDYRKIVKNRYRRDLFTKLPKIDIPERRARTERPHCTLWAAPFLRIKGGRWTGPTASPPPSNDLQIQPIFAPVDCYALSQFDQSEATGVPFPRSVVERPASCASAKLLGTRK